MNTYTLVYFNVIKGEILVHCFEAVSDWAANQYSSGYCNKINKMLYLFNCDNSLLPNTNE